MVALASLHADALALVLHHTDRAWRVLLRLCLVDRATHRHALTQLRPEILKTRAELIEQAAARVARGLAGLREEDAGQTALHRLLKHDAHRPHKQAGRIGTRTASLTAKGELLYSDQYSNHEHDTQAVLAEAAAASLPFKLAGVFAALKDEPPPTAADYFGEPGPWTAMRSWNGSDGWRRWFPSIEQLEAFQVLPGAAGDRAAVNGYSAIRPLLRQLRPGSKWMNVHDMHMTQDGQDLVQAVGVVLLRLVKLQEVAAGSAERQFEQLRQVSARHYGDNGSEE